MGLIILHKLKPKMRTICVEGYCVDSESSAFIGATDDIISQFGIGLFDENTKQTYIWALACPQRLITSWKGMHILDKTTKILSDTICHCYYAGINNDQNSDVKCAIAKLSEQISNFEEFRKNVLGTPIDDAVLDAMLEICNSPHNSIGISDSELKEAVEAGIIHQTTEVTRAYEIATKLRLEEQRNRNLSKQPLPDSKSFCKFCKKSGIKNLFSNPYDDWPSYWSKERIDENLVYSGLTLNGVAEVWCAEHPQNWHNEGHIGQPVLQLDNKRTVVLSLVRFKDDDMWANIRDIKGNGEDEWLKLSVLSALNPHFVGLTFDHNDKPKPKDMELGYIAIKN